MHRQLDAWANHATLDRLWQVTAPTLVIAGGRDLVCPPTWAGGRRRHRRRPVRGVAGGSPPAIPGGARAVEREAGGLLGEPAERAPHGRPRCCEVRSWAVGGDRSVVPKQVGAGAGAAAGSCHRRLADRSAPAGARGAAHSAAASVEQARDRGPNHQDDRGSRLHRAVQQPAAGRPVSEPRMIFAPAFASFARLCCRMAYCARVR